MAEQQRRERLTPASGPLLTSDEIRKILTIEGETRKPGSITHLHTLEADPGTGLTSGFMALAEKINQNPIPVRSNLPIVAAYVDCAEAAGEKDLRKIVAQIGEGLFVNTVYEGRVPLTKTEKRQVDNIRRKSSITSLRNFLNTHPDIALLFDNTDSLSPQQAQELDKLIASLPLENGPLVVIGRTHEEIIDDLNVRRRLASRQQLGPMSAHQIRQLFENTSGRQPTDEEIRMTAGNPKIAHLLTGNDKRYHRMSVQALAEQMMEKVPAVKGANELFKTTGLLRVYDLDIIEVFLHRAKESGIEVPSMNRFQINDIILTLGGHWDSGLKAYGKAGSDSAMLALHGELERPDGTAKLHQAAIHTYSNRISRPNERTIYPGQARYIREIIYHSIQQSFCEGHTVEDILNETKSLVTDFYGRLKESEYLYTLTDEEKGVDIPRLRDLLRTDHMIGILLGEHAQEDLASVLDEK